ncbi:MAG: squalene synthase HpnC [Comamonadaceae bacterium CG1_02_60_18]|nr:MAG: squalene synthase HpnC [Comamonadaceae bacterium CG1_02_60_18]
MRFSTVEHEENFPVASLLCPPALRPAVLAIYHFARTADDLADEGDATPETRLADLSAYRADLLASADRQAPSARWPGVFAPLAQVLLRHQLPLALLLDLLDAFEQDVRYTGQQRRYASQAELLDYCRRSANPVGRLLLHLYSVHDDTAQTQSDQICTALQLINFWQDVSVDVPRQRWYIPQDSMRQFSVSEDDFSPTSTSQNASLLIAHQADFARAMMQKGACLALTLPGRVGWELRLVVQGGMRILDKIEANGCQPWRQRVRLGAGDVVPLLWRARLMGWCSK